MIRIVASPMASPMAPLTGSSSCFVAEQKGQRVLIAAHGNSLRSMVKYLDNMTDEAIMSLNIPTGESKLSRN